MVHAEILLQIFSRTLCQNQERPKYGKKCVEITKLPMLKLMNMFFIREIHSGMSSFFSGRVVPLAHCLPAKKEEADRQENSFPPGGFSKQCSLLRQIPIPQDIKQQSHPIPFLTPLLSFNRMNRIHSIRFRKRQACLSRKNPRECFR